MPRLSAYALVLLPLISCASNPMLIHLAWPPSSVASTNSIGVREIVVNREPLDRGIEISCHAARVVAMQVR